MTARPRPSFTSADRKKWDLAMSTIFDLKVRYELDDDEIAMEVRRTVSNPRRGTRTKKKCEDCKVGHPQYGMPADKSKRRWCAPCAEGHPGSRIYGQSQKITCEDCQSKLPQFGLPSDATKKRRWCHSCVKLGWKLVHKSFLQKCTNR